MIRYELQITTTYASAPGRDVQRGGEEILKFSNINDVIDYIQNRYSRFNIKSLLNKNKVYSDKDADNEYGFTVSFWESDISHNTKAWWQTDWVCIEAVKVSSAMPEIRKLL